MVVRVRGPQRIRVARIQDAGPCMTCGELIEFLMAYVDDELAPDRRAVFDAHLARCEACRRYLATYREAVVLGRDACADPGAPVANEVPEDLVQAILAVRSGVRS